MTNLGAFVRTSFARTAPQFAKKRVARDAHVATTVITRDFRARATRFTRARRAGEFVAIPRATFASRTFFATSWYVAVTLVRTVAAHAALFVLKYPEPRFPLGVVCK